MGPGGAFHQGDAMKRTLIILAAAGFLAATLPAAADEALFKSKGCVKCHDAEKKKKGESVKALSAKYKGDKAAIGKLMATVKGKDHPEVDATDDELKKAIGYAIGAK
jgi:cytochrome c551/c552